MSYTVAGYNIWVSGQTMAVEDKKTKSTAAKDQPAVTPAKTAEAAPKADAVTADAVKAENADPARSNKGMGEGQKPVSQAYKDNWNAIFAKKKKR
jgi:hypothetical protein